MIGVTGLVAVLVSVLCSLLIAVTHFVAGLISIQMFRLPLESVGITVPLLVGWLVAISMPALMLVAIGLVAELIVAERPLDGLYEVVERAGWCSKSDAVLR